MPSYDYEYDCSECGKHVQGSSVYPDIGTLCWDCEETLVKIAKGNATKKCERCGITIAPNNPAVRFCGTCGIFAFHEDYESAFADVIEFCQTHVSFNTAMWNTGGNCMAIGIQGDKYHLLITDDEGPLPWRNEVTGWMVGLYDNEGEEFEGTLEDPHDYIKGATLADLATLLERFIIRIRTEFNITEWEYGEI